MKAYQRREAGIEAVFNLDAWNPRIGCWTKTRRQYASEEAARAAARKPGRYRVSRNDDAGRVELEPFSV